MNSVKKPVWGRDFNLKVRYDCLDDEKVLPSQEAAINSLLASWEVVDGALDSVKEYCTKDSDGELKAAGIKNIFKYVIPHSLFAVRKPAGVVALMCDYRLDLEHGLAIVFKNGELWKLGPQDIVL